MKKKKTSDKIYKNSNYSKIDKFVKKFNLKSFNSKNQVTKYKNFFKLDKLIQNIPEDKIIDKSKKHLINVIKNYKKPHVFEMDDLCRLHWIVLKRRV